MQKYTQALNKKEHKNGMQSPDSPDNDTEFTLTPRTEAKYNKIDEEFTIMMQRTGQINGGRVRIIQAKVTLLVYVGYAKFNKCSSIVTIFINNCIGIQVNAKFVKFLMINSFLCLIKINLLLCFS